jgi:hypothetical protein
MIWHIFKKDFRLLWPFAAAAAALQFGVAAIFFKLGHFNSVPLLADLIDLCWILAYLGTGFLIFTAVHQDRIPGVRQDWLVRPVRRRDLLIAKFSFVILLAQGPIFAADLFQSLANGFPLRQALAAALSRAVFLFLGFSFPVFAFASLTASLTEVVVGGVAIWLGCFGILVLLTALSGGGRSNQYMPVLNTGEGWIIESARSIVALIVGSAILLLQYFRRRTLSSRVLIVAGALLWMFAFYIPWQPAFAIQRKMSLAPGVSDGIAWAFEPERGRAQIAPERLLAAKNQSTDEIAYLPMRVTGLSTDRTLFYDKIETRLVTPDGKTIVLNHGNNLDYHREGVNDSVARGYHGIYVPRDVYNHLKDQPLQLEIDYSVTLFELSSSNALPAIGGDQRMPGAGWCKTRLDEDGDEIEFRCIQAGNGPSCGSIFLDNAKTGLRNPPRSVCNPNYAPYFGKYLYDGMSRIGTALPFHDLTGLAKYPVDASQLSDTRVVIRLFTPQDHFTRRLVLSDIRLSDWTAR